MDYDDEFRRRLVDRYNAMAGREAEDNDAVEKSLRKYGTRAHPILLERLSTINHLPFAAEGFWTTTRTYEMKVAPRGFRANKFMNWVFQPFFDQEELAYASVIYPKTSKKTFDATTGLSIFEEIGDWITTTTNHVGGLPNLRDMIRINQGEALCSDLFCDDINESLLGRSINRFLVENEGQFPADSFVQIPGRIIAPDLVMKTKYYPSRDDNRAYCQDTSLPRSLSGACLQRLILPKSMRTRSGLDWCKVVPARDKDKLDMTFPLPPEGHILLAIFGDISNFTGSAANSWLMLYCMASECSLGGLKGKEPNMYCVDGKFFEATWEDILRVYLYHNVGYPCHVDDQDRYAYLPGGFLGVNANIISGLLWLSVVLENFRLIHEDYIISIKTQAGGDDFVVFMTIKAECRTEAKRFIHKEMRDYVGYVKELMDVVISDQPNGCLASVDFCRKRVFVERSHNTVRVRTEETVPLSEVLFKNFVPKSARAQQKLWQDFDQSLRMFELKEPSKRAASGTFRHLFLSKYQLARPLRSKNRRTVSYHWGVRSIDGLSYTVSALERIQGCPPVYGSVQTYLTDLQTCCQYLLRYELLQLREVWYGGSLTKIIVTRNEGRNLDKFAKRQIIELDYEVDHRLLQKVLN